MPKRRYQEGLFKREGECFYSFFYKDRAMPDGSTRSVLTRTNLGRVGSISELSARREHDRLRQLINRERGSVPTAPKGETFKEVADTYLKAVGPHLSPATTRQRQSHLGAHLLPRFGSSALMSIGVPQVQQFTTDMLTTASSKSIDNVLGTLFAILKYAKKCGVRAPEFSMADLTLASERSQPKTPYFKPTDVQNILALAREPYRTAFALAWATGLRAGELFGLTVQDVDLERGFVHPHLQADDRTRELRSLKTRQSSSPVPITPETVAMLKSYLEHHWRPNEQNLLFANKLGRPIKRAHAVQYGLRPVLVKLGLPVRGVGFHAFRRGLGTALANSRVSPRVVQSILRHTDLKTTLAFYVHVDEDVQRTALQSLQL